MPARTQTTRTRHVEWRARAGPFHATRQSTRGHVTRQVTMYERGYKLGFIGSKEIPGTDPRVPYLNNHLRFIVKYHNDEAFVGSRIVG